MRDPRLPALVALATLTFGFEARAQECQDDGDCAPDEECLLDDVSVADCPPGVDCERPEVEPRGYCYAKPVTCQRNADCPEPTVCGDDGECQFVFELCTSDAMCGERYACTDIGGGPSCESSGDSGSETASSGDAEDLGGDVGDPGDAKAVPDPAQGTNPVAAEDVANPPPDVPQAPDEEVCEPPEPRLICFPRPEECDDDSDCAGDWICYDMPEGGPDGWDGIERACMPPGLVDVFDGRIDAEGSSTSHDEGESGSGKGDDLIDEDDVDAPTNDDVGLGTQGGSEGSSGCALGGGGAPKFGAALMLLFGIALGWRRRRS